jgi:phosphate starvation-inducible protein PhoH
MKVQVQLTAGIESLFGTRDENIRLIEEALEVRTRVTNDSIEIEGEDQSVLRAESILVDYSGLLREGFVFQNGEALASGLDASLNSQSGRDVEPHDTTCSAPDAGRRDAHGAQNHADSTGSIEGLCSFHEVAKNLPDRICDHNPGNRTGYDY